jgi:hypothetical protein
MRIATKVGLGRSWSTLTQIDPGATLAVGAACGEAGGIRPYYRHESLEIYRLA